ncbi:protein FAR1-RELATED SEQUENCE 5 [Artemisia annua]|uniref:Protein FAR1-RELATED SEQUENCE 5 n=1 Tax=Artemisia annua TaxID=35608 RepID=A0A2U1PJN0_ARTAN|nr:protein FAR1-RELATED SEQUENCE 5 [Artemisia annua]
MGMEFDTVDDAWHFWINYGMRMGFDVRRQWFNKNKNDGTITSMRFVCNKEGVRRNDKRDILTQCPRAETRTNCLCRMGILFNKQVKKYMVHDFVLEHNHLLHIPETVHMMSSQRKISEVQAMEIDLADDSGIKTKASYELMSRRGGGKETVGYTLTNQKNYLRRRRQRELKYGKAGGLLRSLSPKLVKLASRASESQEACELVERLIGELTTQVESICLTQNRGDGDDSKVKESLSKNKDSNGKLPVGVKGLKKKVGKEGRPRMKSWLSNKDASDSVANVIFEKVKGYFNCHPQGMMNNSNSCYPPIDNNELYHQELHHNGSFHLLQASNLSYSDFVMESGSQLLNSHWGQAK